MDPVATPDQAVLGAIGALLERRGATGIDVTPASALSADLGLDSLDLAELSVMLEDELGSDPFSDGIVPATVGDLLGFYGG